MTDQGPISAEFERFRQTFFEECAEMLADMEERLSRLQAEGLDKEELDAVFRAVHSIKAGAGAFNFTRLVSLSHAFEALLDRLRDGRMGLEPEVATLIIQSGDILSEMVAAAREGRELEPSFESDALALLKAMVGGEAAPKVAAVSASVAPVANGLKTWRIEFTPKAELFRHANEPLLLIRELKGLGDLEVEARTDKLPTLEALEPEDAYVGFTFTLMTDKGRDAIAEVFEFVDSDCTLDIEDITATTVADDDDGFGFFEPINEVSPQPAAFAVAEVSPVPAVAAAATTTAPAARSAQPQAATQALQSIRVDLNRVDRLVNMVGELVIAQAILRQEISYLSEQHLSQGQGLHALEGLEGLETLTREMQDCVMAIRMQPVKSVFSRMPRLVREVSGKLGKTVKLVMNGEQTELDKTVIEELADPLTHMIRNSIDHGLESPEQRLAAGKPIEGTITLSAAHVGSNILIHIEDDGAGINRERVYNKAVEKGVIAAGTKLNDDEILELIFAAGFSTAAQVTDVSGRGVGMDVVRRNIMKMGGRIHLSSVEGKGSRFTLVIPLTLAVLDGMLLAVGSERYILPLTSIVESFKPSKQMLRELVGGAMLASVRGQYYPLIFLHRLFGVRGAQIDPTRALIVLVETASGGRIGIVVDELIGQQQVVIKSLQENYVPILGLSGATILGDGRVALILDIEQLGTVAHQVAQSSHQPSQDEIAA